jgi:hypothetical protein
MASTPLFPVFPRSLQAVKRLQISQVPSADRIDSVQVIELIVVSSNQETSAFWQDWMVERRGFEMMAIGALGASKSMVRQGPPT